MLRLVLMWQKNKQTNKQQKKVYTGRESGRASLALPLVSFREALGDIFHCVCALSAYPLQNILGTVK